MRKHRLILFAAAAALTVVLAGCGKDSGDGTEKVPEGWTPVRTAAELYTVRYNLSGNYILMNDISLAGYSFSTDWTPIGTGEAPFTGIFDGNNHKITDLTITSAHPLYVGLFGCINGGSVSNLGVEISPDKVNGAAVGGIAGIILNGSIKNCYSKGNISGWVSGGIVGEIARGSIITDCYSTGDITANDYQYGSYSCIFISSGGIAGLVYGNSTITNCYSTGNCSANDYYGHVRMYAIVNGMINPATGAYFVSSGGIAGYVDDGTITGCAAINTTIDATIYYDGVPRAGRIVGLTYGGTNTIANNFASSAMTVTGTSPYSNNGVDKTDGELQTRTTYQSSLGWAFGSTAAAPWKMPAGGGYPILYWQK